MLVHLALQVMQVKVLRMQFRGLKFRGQPIDHETTKLYPLKICIYMVTIHMK